MHSAGLILNLENRPFTKSQGKPGMVRESTVIFIQVGEKSWKANYLVHVSFSCTVVC